MLKGEAWKQDKYRAPNGEDTGSGGELRLRKCGANTKCCRSYWATRVVSKSMRNYVEMHLHRASTIAAIEAFPRGAIRPLNKSLESPQWV